MPKEDSTNREDSVWTEALSALATFSGWVAVPVIIGSLFGMWLDSNFGTDPWLFLFSVGTAFIFSMIGLVRIATKKLKSFEKKSTQVASHDKVDGDKKNDK